jgi:hypothetical protein
MRSSLCVCVCLYVLHVWDDDKVTLLAYNAVEPCLVRCVRWRHASCGTIICRQYGRRISGGLRLVPALNHLAAFQSITRLDYCGIRVPGLIDFPALTFPHLPRLQKR